MVKLWNKIRRFVASVFGRYEAATYSIGRSWLPGGLADARIDISKSTREEIMRKARYFEKNSAIARRIGSVYCDFTVGSTGMVFNMASSDPEWNARAKEYWEQTAMRIDLNSRQTFGSLQQLVAWRDIFDGDCFIIKTRKQDRSGKFWPAIQIIEAHLCKTPPRLQANEGTSVIDGVQVDANGRPTGYWFESSAGSENFRLIESSNVIACFDPERSRQCRGISGFAAAINYLHRLDDLQELEYRAAADAAEKSTFVYSENGEIPRSMRSRLVAADQASQPIPGLTPAQIADGIRERIGGRTVSVPLNSKVEQHLPNRPTDSTRALWSYLTSCVCAAVGIPKVICFSEWLDSAQGTIVRGDYDIAAQFFRSRSAIYAAAFREVVIYVLSWGIQTDKRLADPPADWVNIVSTAPRAINVDVGRNSVAKLNELKVGLTSHEAEYAALGLDARAEISKQIRFIAFVKAECAAVSAMEGVEVSPAEILGEIVTGAEPPQQPDQPNVPTTAMADD